MNSPILWIIFPGFVSVILLALQRWNRATYIAGTAVAIILAGFAWLIPIGENIRIGNITIPFGDTLTILGRRFVIGSGDRATLLLIYAGLAFWLLGSWAAHSSRLFVPLGLGVASLLTAALAVEPFLYAALILEVVVLVSIPLISSPGTPTSRGATRYLIYLTLGFPFILFTGWLLAGTDTSTVNIDQVILAFVLMGLGFWLLMGIFPFHTWIPMISEESHPYAAAFLLYELPLATFLFGLSFLDRYAWLRETAGLYTVLEIGGVVMIFIAGILAAFQNHLGRILGYVILVEIGLSLLAIRVGLEPGENGRLLGLFYTILLPRALSLGVWALALVTIIRSAVDYQGGPITSRNLTFKMVQGNARRTPIAAISLLLAFFSLAGLPLLVGFPIRLALWEEIAKISIFIAGAVLLGYLGLLIGGMRTMAVLVSGSEDTAWEINESRSERILLIIGSIALVGMGLLPQLFMPALSQVIEVFTQVVQ